MQTLRLILAIAGTALALPLSAAAQSLDDLGEMSPQERPVGFDTALLDAGYQGYQADAK